MINKIATEQIYLKVGDWHFTDRPLQIKTLLGSCVSVCLYAPYHGLGAMNHIFMALKDGPIDMRTEAGKYGVTCMELMINEFVKRGIPRQRLQAKVFGGAHSNSYTSSQLNLTAARKNVEFVLRFLRTEGIPILVNDTGGRMARSVTFNTDDYEVQVRYHDHSKPFALQQHEIEKSLSSPPPPNRTVIW